MSEKSSIGFKGGLRIKFSSECIFDLVCGQSGRRYPSGQLDAPVSVFPWQMIALQYFLARCEADDTQDTFSFQLNDGNFKKSLLLFVEITPGQRCISIDGVGLERVRKIFMPSCIREGLSKIFELCVTAG